MSRALIQSVVEDACRMAESGCNEYAEGGLFAHFDEVAKALTLRREMIIDVHLSKHLLVLRKRRSMREPLHGRFLDAIVYAALRSVSDRRLTPNLESVKQVIERAVDEMWRRVDVYGDLAEILSSRSLDLAGSLILAAAEGVE